ncbi:MAG TPA: hypothetical protein VFY89_09515, partial [Ktedonobacterales bacterium]
MAISQTMAPISQPLIEPPTFAVSAEHPSAEGASGMPTSSAEGGMPPIAPTPDASAAEASPPMAAPRPSGQVTRPLSRPLAPITGPLAPTTDPLTSPSGSGNLWERLSQALMGIPPVDPSGEWDGAETPPPGPADAQEHG